MKSYPPQRKRCLFLLLTILLLGSTTAWAMTTRHIVTFTPETPVTLQEEIVTTSGGTILQRLPLLHALVIQVPADHPEATLQALRTHPAVAAVEPDTSITAQSRGHFEGTFITPVDPEPVEGGYTWNLLQIYLDEVDPVIQGQGVTIAVLDTGIDPEHPDLAGAVIGGYNARAGEDPDDYLDRNGHGTHIAGIIAAAAGAPDEWRVMRGIAPQVQLYAVRVLADDGGGYLSDLINGLSWVYEHPEIRVVNMSLGFSQGSPLLHQIIKQLHKAGVVLIASAGNYDTLGASGEGAAGEGAAGEGAAGKGEKCSGAAGEGAAGEGAAGEGAAGEGAAGKGEKDGCNQQRVKYPARYKETIAVGATDIDGTVTTYSIRGPEVDLVAPGGTLEHPIVSLTSSTTFTSPTAVAQGEGAAGEGAAGEGAAGEGAAGEGAAGTGYGVGSGTSQSAAHVTGVVALLLSANPDLGPKDVRKILQKTAFDLGADRKAQGAGLIDAALAVETALHW